MRTIVASSARSKTVVLMLSCFRLKFHLSGSSGSDRSLSGPLVFWSLRPHYQLSFSFIIPTCYQFLNMVRLHQLTAFTIYSYEHPLHRNNQCTHAYITNKTPQKERRPKGKEGKGTITHYCPPPNLQPPTSEHLLYSPTIYIMLLPHSLLPPV